ncbi:MAG: hypothetical protein HPY53_02320 [Brevinematales bacterium]|nr:hypothetical protein [Brevinematales bacterium]
MKIYISFIAVLISLSLAACGEVSDLSRFQGTWYVSETKTTNGIVTNYQSTNTFMKYSFDSLTMIACFYGYTTNITTNDYYVREALSRLTIADNTTNTYVFYSFTDDLHMTWTVKSNIASGVSAIGGKSGYTYWKLTLQGN